MMVVLWILGGIGVIVFLFGAMYTIRQGWDEDIDTRRNMADVMKSRMEGPKK